ncbi:MAG: hypothetical protein HY554_16965 [Elusimicrobia bacterium]|nr:hypothetical protein [Elusimicrobiota bacterium]
MGHRLLVLCAASIAVIAGRASAATETSCETNFGRPNYNQIRDVSCEARCPGAGDTARVLEGYSNENIHFESETDGPVATCRWSETDLHRERWAAQCPSGDCPSKWGRVICRVGCEGQAGPEPAPEPSPTPTPIPCAPGHAAVSGCLPRPIETVSCEADFHRPSYKNIAPVSCKAQCAPGAFAEFVEGYQNEDIKLTGSSFDSTGGCRWEETPAHRAKWQAACPNGNCPSRWGKVNCSFACKAAPPGEQSTRKSMEFQYEATAATKENSGVEAVCNSFGGIGTNCAGDPRDYSGGLGFAGPFNVKPVASLASGLQHLRAGGATEAEIRFINSGDPNEGDRHKLFHYYAEIAVARWEIENARQKRPTARIMAPIQTENGVRGRSIDMPRDEAIAAYQKWLDQLLDPATKRLMVGDINLTADDRFPDVTAEPERGCNARFTSDGSVDSLRASCVARCDRGTPVLYSIYSSESIDNRVTIDGPYARCEWFPRASELDRLRRDCPNEPGKNCGWGLTQCRFSCRQ